MALTDTQQGLLVLVSTLMISLGAASVPSGQPWYVGLGLMVCGAIGMAIKEFLGNAPKETPAPVPVS